MTLKFSPPPYFSISFIIEGKVDEKQRKYRLVASESVFTVIHQFTDRIITLWVNKT